MYLVIFINSGACHGRYARFYGASNIQVRFEDPGIVEDWPPPRWCNRYLGCGSANSTTYRRTRVGYKNIQLLRLEQCWDILGSFVFGTPFMILETVAQSRLLRKYWMSTVQICSDSCSRKEVHLFSVEEAVPVRWQSAEDFLKRNNKTAYSHVIWQRDEIQWVADLNLRHFEDPRGAGGLGVPVVC